MRFRVSRMLVSLVLVLATVPATAGGAPVTASEAPGPVFAKAMGLADGAGAVGDAAAVSALASNASEAVTLPVSPVAGALAAPGDSDLYSVELAAGSRIEVSLVATAPAFDVYLYPPGTTDLASAIAVAHASEGGYPRTLAYDVPTDVSGTYYLEVYAYEGTGAYTVAYTISSAGERTRQDVGAAVSVTLPVTETVTVAPTLDANVLRKFYVGAGRRITVDLAGPSNADFDVYLYRPDTTSILPSTVQPAAYGNGPTANEHVVFDVPAGGAGTYYLEVLRFSGSGQADLRIAQAMTPPAPSVLRVAGVDRYGTAVEVSRMSFPAGSRRAVICSGVSFPDGLSASSLAGAIDGPILLTGPAYVPPSVGDELQRLGVDTVYIVGGTAAVRFAVESQIEAYVPNVRILRVAGATRYETAGEVADWVHEILGTRPSRVFLASGEKFPDALALSPISFRMHMPIILTMQAELPASSAAAIARIRGAEDRTLNVLVAGGEAAVSSAAAAVAGGVAGGVVTRAYGRDRYETALAIAETAVLSRWADQATLSVASGVTFPDALGGASLPGSTAGVMLLCPVSILGTWSDAYMRSWDFRIETAWVFGGEAAVRDQVVTDIQTILPNTPPPQ